MKVLEGRLPGGETQFTNNVQIEDRALKGISYLSVRFFLNEGMPCYNELDDCLLDKCRIPKDVAIDILKTFREGFRYPIDQCRMVIEAKLDWQNHMPAETMVLPW